MAVDEARWEGFGPREILSMVHYETGLRVVQIFAGRHWESEIVLRLYRLCRVDVTGVVGRAGFRDNSWTERLQ